MKTTTKRDGFEKCERCGSTERYFFTSRNNAHPGGTCVGCHLNRIATYRQNPDWRRKQYAKTTAWKRRGMVPSPDERCRICGILDNKFSPLQWDHSHAIDKFRGWLCGPCNRVLGQARDNVDVLRAAAHYLEAA